MRHYLALAALIALASCTVAEGAMPPRQDTGYSPVAKPGKDASYTPNEQLEAIAEGTRAIPFSFNNPTGYPRWAVRCPSGEGPVSDGNGGFLCAAVKHCAHDAGCAAGITHAATAGCAFTIQEGIITGASCPDAGMP